MVGRKLYDLFDERKGAAEDERVNPELMRVARDDWASNRMRDRRTPRGRGPKGRGGRPVGNGRRSGSPAAPRSLRAAAE